MVSQNLLQQTKQKSGRQMNRRVRIKVISKN